MDDTFFDSITTLERGDLDGRVGRLDLGEVLGVELQNTHYERIGEAIEVNERKERSDEDWNKERNEK